MPGWAWRFQRQARPAKKGFYAGQDLQESIIRLEDLRTATKGFYAGLDSPPGCFSQLGGPKAGQARLKSRPTFGEICVADPAEDAICV